MTTIPLSSHLEGLLRLQVTHNRLPGSGRRVQSSWLHAFNWALFSDPLLVWNASEVSEQVGAGSPFTRRQWRVTYNGDGAKATADSGRLQAIDNVPPIIRHIWGLPLARSEGFDDAATPAEASTLYRMASSGWQASQTTAGGGGAGVSDSLTRQGRSRATPRSSAHATSSTTIINNNNNYNP